MYNKLSKFIKAARSLDFEVVSCYSEQASMGAEFFVKSHNLTFEIRGRGHEDFIRVFISDNGTICLGRAESPTDMLHIMAEESARIDREQEEKAARH